MPQKIRLTVSPQVREKLQHNRSYDGNTSQLSFYVKPDYAAKINALAAKNKRSVSSVLAEMVEFAMNSLEDGDTILEETPSTMHPLPRTSPLSEYDFAPAKQSKGGGVKLRMVSAAPPPTSEEISQKTLNERMPQWAGIDEGAVTATRRERMARGHGTAADYAAEEEANA